jgi:hypothetical protein
MDAHQGTELTSKSTPNLELNTRIFHKKKHLLQKKTGKEKKF